MRDPSRRRSRRLAPCGQAELVQQLGAAVGARGSEQLQRLGHPEPVRQRRVLQLAAYKWPQPLRLAHRVMAENAQRPGTRGDQIVTVDVVVPTLQDERSREIMRELAKLNNQDPRVELFNKL